MSIQRTGPANYRYQDRVAVWLTLAFWDKQNLEVWNDRDGIYEDVLITHDDNGEKVTLEVQCKGDKNFSDDLFISCLTHYGDKQAEVCFLSKLIEGTNGLLVTKGRCGTLPEKFIKAIAEVTSVENNIKITKRVVDNLVSLIAATDETTKKSNLASLRRKNLTSLVKDKKNELGTALQRIAVCELLSEDDLVDKIKSILIEQHFVPFDVAFELADKLTCTARRSVEEQFELAEACKSIIASYSQAKNISGSYVLRGSEEKLLIEMGENDLLLLSGTPRCGKSFMGKHLLDEMSNHGYLIKQVLTINEAEKALLSASSQVCVLLDDPFGSRGVLQDNSPSLLVRFKKLCKLAGRGRRLIVCQSQDELIRIFGKKNITQCRVNRASWHDLSLPSVIFLESVWDVLKEQGEVDADLDRIVVKLIQDGSSIDPGALEYLAFNSDCLPCPYDEKKCLALIKQDASDLALQLKDSLSPASQDFLVTLALATFSTKEIACEDLGFILSLDCPSNYPGKKEIGQAFGFSSTISKKSLSYNEEYSLSEECEEIIFDLKRRRLISTEQHRVFFRHSFYQAASEQLICEFFSSRLKEILKGCERGLYCASPQVAISIANSIPHASDLVEEEYQAYFAQLAYKARESCFPTCYHSVMPYLSDHLMMLDDNQRNIFLEHPENSRVSLHDLKWKEGEAWIPEFISFVGEVEDAVDDVWVADKVAKLTQRNSPSPTAEEISRLLGCFKKQPEKLLLSIAEEILLYDNALIRSEVARCWLKVSRTNDDALLKKMFSDSIPTVVGQCFDTMRKCWGSYDDNRKEVLLETLLQVSEKPLNACVLFERLVNHCKHNQECPIELFKAIMPVVLLSGAPLANVSSGRLYLSLEQVTQNISVEEAMVLFDAWYVRICKWVSQGMADEFQLSIVTLLVDVTKNKGELRQSLSRKILDQTSTEPLLCFLRDYIDNWELLYSVEQEKILTILKKPVAETKWMQAMALTRKSIPKKIQFTVFGDEDFMERQQSDLINEIDNELLARMVCIYCGNPQPLWWYGTHHANKEYWEHILFEIGKNVDHPLFQIVLAELMLQENEQAICDVITANAGKEEKFFSLFLAESIEQNLPRLIDSWEFLFDLPLTLEIKQSWYEQLAEALPYVADGVSDIALIFEDNAKREALFKALKRDHAILSSLHMVSNNLSDLKKNDLLLKFAELALKLTPLLHKTIQQVMDVLSENGFEGTKEYQQLEENRITAIGLMRSLNGKKGFVADWTIPLITKSNQFSIRLPETV